MLAPLSISYFSRRWIWMYDKLSFCRPKTHGVMTIQMMVSQMLWVPSVLLNSNCANTYSCCCWVGCVGKLLLLRWSRMEPLETDGGGSAGGRKSGGFGGGSWTAKMPTAGGAEARGTVGHWSVGLGGVIVIVWANRTHQEHPYPSQARSETLSSVG